MYSIAEIRVYEFGNLLEGSDVYSYVPPEYDLGRDIYTGYQLAQNLATNLDKRASTLDVMAFLHPIVDADGNVDESISSCYRVNFDNAGLVGSNH